MSKENNKNKLYIFGSSLIYLIFLLFLLFSLKSIYLSQDESFTFCLIHRSFSQITKFTAMDVHPFMYYFIAKLFIWPFHGIYTQILSLRILSAVPYLVLLILGNTTIKRRFGKSVSLLFMFLTITMPFLNKYMYIARMYSIAMLFTTVTFFVFIYIYKGFISNTILSGISLSVFSLFGAYSHYFSLIACGVMYMIFIFLFLVKNRKIIYLLLSAFIDIICYLPWLIMVLFKQMKKAKGSFWTTPLTIKNIAKSFIKIFSPIMDVSFNNHVELADAILVILLSIMMICLFIHYKEYKNSIINIGISIFLVTFLIGIILSALVHHSILLPRFFIPTLGIFWFAISLFISKNEKSMHFPKKIFVLGLVLFGMMSYSFNIYNLTSNNQIFKNSLTLIKKNIPKNSTIIYSSNAPSSSLSSYLNKDNNEILTPTSAQMKLYNTVFKRESKSDVSINKKSQNFFIESIDKDKPLDNKFFNKYKSRLISKGNICSPIDDNNKSVLYKICKK